MSQRSVVSRKELDWNDIEKYPLSDGQYEFDLDCGRHGMYARLFRNYSDEDANVLLHSSHSDTDKRIRLVDGGNLKKSTQSFYYYPKCKKAIGTGLANMHGTADWVDILKKMGVENPRFTIGVGFDPFIGYSVGNTKHAADEVDVCFEFTMRFELTFSNKKPLNYVNFKEHNID